jgi:hypothetical protein
MEQFIKWLKYRPQTFKDVIRSNYQYFIKCKETNHGFCIAIYHWSAALAKQLPDFWHVRLTNQVTTIERRLYFNVLN